MQQSRASRPSPAMLVAILALVAALAGTAIAGPDAITSAVSRSTVKKIAKTQVKKGLKSKHVHEVGTAGEPPFENDWGNGDLEYSTAGFYKDPLHVVHLSGFLEAPTSGSTIFTLPPGYRPSLNLYLPVAAENTFGTLNVLADGRLIGRCEPSNTNCTLGIDGLSFRVR